jgi:CHAD domain-containing protein
MRSVIFIRGRSSTKIKPESVKPATKTTGLRYWMERVLEECDQVAADFSADPVHDLRVALRRCRSMADGLMAMDPAPDWRAMKKAGKRLFRRLGDLRDVQIMMDWIDKLHPGGEWSNGTRTPSSSDHQQENPKEADPHDKKTSRAELADGEHADHAHVGEEQPDAEKIADPYPDRDADRARDPVAQALFEILRHRETEEKHEARAALDEDEFDRKQWRQWSKTLPVRAARIRPGSAVFKHLALERWTAARELHTRALRNRSQVAFHTLRIGIKRFRYIVENFLPAEHKAWSDDIKHMQDLLGEVHDLDVLWSTALSSHVFPDAASRKRWHTRILEERTKRIEEYRKKTVGPDSLWNVWRAGLPQGEQIRRIATQRMKLWARALDPDFAHSERVARLSLELYDGLKAIRLLGFGDGTNEKGRSTDHTPNNQSSDVRACLYAAALLHDVGKSKGEKGHHKESLDLINKHGTPLGWNERDLRRAGVIARFHCGALPTRGHKALRDLLPDEQKMIIRLAAILRLANALDSVHDGHIGRVKIENAIAESRNHRPRTNGFVRKPTSPGKNEALVIAAEGYADGTPTAQSVAAERYLLETVLRRPVVVKPMRLSTATKNVLG